MQFLLLSKKVVLPIFTINFTSDFWKINEIINLQQEVWLSKHAK